MLNQQDKMSSEAAIFHPSWSPQAWFDSVVSFLF